MKKMKQDHGVIINLQTLVKLEKINRLSVDTFMPLNV